MQGIYVTVMKIFAFLQSRRDHRPSVCWSCMPRSIVGVSRALLQVTLTMRTLRQLALLIDKTYKKNIISIQIKFSLKVTTWPTWWLSLPFLSVFVSYGDFRQLTPRSPEIMHVHYSVYLSAQKSTDSFQAQL